MRFLARKIARAKWDKTEKTAFLEDAEPSADALTRCLRSEDNALSTWQCDAADKESCQEAGLALASAYNKLDKLHLVILSAEDLQAVGVELKSAPESATTPVEDLKKHHVDLANLSGSRLLAVAKLITPKVRNDRGCHTFTRKEILGLLNAAIASRRLSRDKLDEKLQADIEKASKG